VIFTAPRLVLVDQSFSRFVANGIDPEMMGIIQANHPWSRPDAPLQIASVDTLERRGFPENIDVALIDECHIRREGVEKWLASAKHLFIGLSATPWRRGMGLVWDDLIVPGTIDELIEEGYICKSRVFAPSHPDLSGIKKVAGDFHEGQLAERMSGDKLVADVVLTWCEKAEGRPTLLFAVNRAHADVLHQQFQAAGVASAYVDADTPREERAQMGRDLERGQLKVICSVQTMTLGVDLPVHCVSYCRPTWSEMMFCQALGRGLRPLPGKEYALILDHSDTHRRLGMVADIYGMHGGLDHRKPGEKVAGCHKELPVIAPTECKGCGALMAPRITKCEACGWVRKAHSRVETVDGELVEMERGMRLAHKENREMTHDQKALWFAQLKGFGEENGYKAGWAPNKYKHKFGVWPNAYRYVEAVYCGPTVRAWVGAEHRKWMHTRPYRSAERIIQESLSQ
jgi:DNA repair protein RadD